MRESHLDKVFLKLVRNILNKNNKVTIFIGAGCSLTSSNKDITTYGIIKDLVKTYKIENEKVPENWIELYSKFVNDIWNGQGNQNKIQLLKEYFENMSPSIGYENLRWLAENNYIQNIITTNFDLMIDQVLDGLSYNLIVGTKDVRKVENAKFTVIKAHGDLNSGELRFSPEDLNHLPNDLSQKISTCSKGTLLVVGFKGQDIGVIDALDTSGEYNSYWTSPEELDKLNNYENHQIISFMKKRKSEPNYLYGNDYGKFDELMINIKNKINEISLNELEQQKNQISQLWENCSWLFFNFDMNKRFLDIFHELFQIIYDYTKNLHWQIVAPYFSFDFETLLKKSITLMSKNILPKKDIKCIDNEVDALLFSFSYSVNIASIGYNISSKELIKSIKEDYEDLNNDIEIGESFWGKASILADTDSNNELIFDYDKVPIKFYFDKGKNLQTILKHVDVAAMKQLLITIKTILLFNKTSSQIPEPLASYNYKQILEQNFYSINIYENKIHLRISQMNLNTYTNIFNYLLKPIFTEYVIDDERILKYNNIRATVSVEDADDLESDTFFDNFINQSEKLKKQFFYNFIVDDNVKREHLNIFNSFLSAQSNGLFIIGESGSGKTTSLQIWLSSLNSSKYLVYPVFGRELDINNENNTENIICTKQEQLENIELMLKQRDKVLIIVIDAINEIQASFHRIISFYEKILEFSNFIAKNKYLRIKIIVSSRMDFYNQIISATNKFPSASSYYSVFSKDQGNETKTVFEIPLLNGNEIISFVKTLSSNKTITFESLYKEFGDLIALPFNLRLICDAITTQTIYEDKFNNIFESWFMHLNNLAKEEQITNDAIISVIYKVLQYKYFDSPYDNVQTYRLSSDLNYLYPNILQVYEWLVSQKVFVKIDTHPNLIQFSHDKIEEFFLNKYLNERYENELSKIELYFNKEALNNPIVKQSLSDVIKYNFIYKRLKFTTDIIDIINNENEMILAIWIDVLFYLSSEYCETIFSFFKTIESYLLKSKFIKFINNILYIINEKLDNINDVGINIINIMCKIIDSTNCSEDVILQQYGRLLNAKYLYIFADENNTDVFSDALAICENIESALKNEKQGNFLDSVHYLKALLLQNQGDLNSAIELMESCYNSQIANAAYNLSAKSAVNLGSMYREMTRFDEAIALYDSVKTDYILDLEFKYRLLMNKGTIYKNKIQNALFDGFKSTYENQKNYENAMSLFNSTYDYAQKQDNVKLLFEVCAEFIELSCIAYYMEIGTIEDSCYWGNKIDEILPRFNVPVARVDRLKLWARIDVLSCDFEGALRRLEDGFSIAIKYNIPFRASDCCNIITGVICDMIDRHLEISQIIIDKGLFYGNYSIEYYQKLNNPNHRYLKDSIIKVDKISSYKK